jgi:hypothetical protein
VLPAVLAALLLLLPSPGLVPATPLPGAPDSMEAALHLALGLRGGPWPGGPGAMVPRTLTAAVVDAYATLGLPAPDAAQREAMARMEAALPPGIGSHGAALLAALVAPGPALARAPAAAKAADAVGQALHEAPAVLAEGGFLFRDPLDLVLVGDAGPNLYQGNRVAEAAPEVPIAPWANLLTLDPGGDDVYRNNAGGASPRVGLCPGAGCGVGLPGAAAVDAGGHDRYEAVVVDEVSRLLTVQGAGAYGALGLLLDLGGDDAYLLDATLGPRGSGDVVVAQGAAGLGGLGLLVDLGGRDAYQARLHRSGHAQSTLLAQGAADLYGLAALADAAGDDVRSARIEGPMIGLAVLLAHGAGFGLGTSVLVDGGGHDRHEAALVVPSAWADLHAQGVGEAGGQGALLDLGGDDAYVVALEALSATAIAQGEGQGGRGLLLDAGGRDAYTAAHAGDGKAWVQGSAGVGLDLA